MIRYICTRDQPLSPPSTTRKAILCNMARNVSIKNLSEVLAARAARPAVMKAQKVNGNWHMPKMSAKAIARLRKQHIIAGKEWKWDVPHKLVEKRMPFKGHKRVLRAIQKKEEIARCMERMPKLIAAYRKDRPKKKKYEGISAALLEPRERSGVRQRR